MTPLWISREFLKISFGLITTPLSLSTDKIRAQICEQKKYRDIKLWYTIHTAVELSKNTTTHTHEWFYENQNKMEAFYRPAVSPFQLPPLSTIYPPLSKPLSKKTVLEKAGTHYWNHCCWIFDTVIKIIIIDSSPPPFLGARQTNLVTFATKIGIFFLFKTLLHFIITTMQLWKRTEIYKYYLALKLPEKNTLHPTTLLSFKWSVNGFGWSFVFDFVLIFHLT